MMARPAALVALLSIVSLLSCSKHEATPIASCSSVGQRLHKLPIDGIILGELGTKAKIEACPGLMIPLVLIGADDAEYARLRRVAAERIDVVGFRAVGNGYVVADGPGDYLLLLITLSNVREDPSVAKAAPRAKD